MIVYFADRYFNILGQASTELPGGLTIIDDRKVGDVDSGVTVFEFTLPFNDNTRAMAEACGAVGNYLLRSRNGEQDFYTIIDAEVDTKRQEVTVYAEDAGLDLLNEIVFAYEPTTAQNIAHYINKFAFDSGFVIGVNESGSTTKKLAWTDEATAAERIADVAKQFGCEISYSFEIDGLAVTKKLINVYKERGTDAGVQLRLNKEVDRIVTKTSIANLATALLPTGGTPEDAEYPIDLSGYTYDDGDFYLDGRYLKSRSAIQKWSRYLNPAEPSTTYTGHVLKKFTCEALTQAALCSEAVAELKRISDIEVNFDIEMNELPEGVGLGDRVNVVDDAGELYISARLLELEESVANRSVNATIGDYLIKGSGVSQKVADLAAQFAAKSAEVAAAYQAAQAAKEAAETAKTAADDAQATATTVENKIDGLQIGGRNLILNSKEKRLSPMATPSISYEVFAVEEWSASDAIRVYGTSGTSHIFGFLLADGLDDKISLSGREYVYSIYIKNTGTGTVSVTTNGLGTGAEIASGESKKIVLYGTGNGTQNVQMNFQVGAAGGAFDFVYWHPQIEYGNKATDWTPAPEDMASGADVTELATKVTETAEAVTAQGIEISELGDSVNNMEIGGRNLLINSDISYTVTGTGTAASYNSKGVGEYGMNVEEVQKLKPGDYVTVSVYVKAESAVFGGSGSNRCGFEIEFKRTDGTARYIGAWAYDLTDFDGRISTSLPILDEDDFTGANSQPYLYIQGLQSGTVTVSRPKLERGTKPTDWTPAPEDVDVDISDAAKTATNFLSYDATNGLQVGNKTAGEWDGYRAQVKADSFNVLDADGNTLSTFGANEIDLGKNNEDTVIKMCGGKAEIKYDTNEVSAVYDSATFSSGSVAVKGTDDAAVYAQNAVDQSDGTTIVTRGSFIASKLYGAAMTAESWTEGADGVNVGDVVRSSIYMQPNSIMVDSADAVLITTPIVSVTGDVGVDGDVSVTGDIDVNGARVLTESDIQTGTWTASINGGTITEQKCTYQKVGNMCTLSFYIQGTGGTTSTSNFYLSGAPFYPADGPTWYGGGGHVQGLYDTSNYPVTGCIIQTSNKRIYFRTSQAGGTATGYVRVGNGGATFYLSGTITYPIAE